MKLSKIIIIGLILSTSACTERKSNESEKISLETSQEGQNEKLSKIPILNVGTFHMGFTTDANTTEFDQHDKENQLKVHDIVKKIALFKPTVIIVEALPEYDEKLQAQYKAYIENPNMFFKSPSEVELLAFELGRLSKTERIYGIDHKMNYNYLIAKEIENSIDSGFVNNFYTNPLQFYPEVDIDEDALNLLDKLKLTNNQQYLDFLMTINADIMTHVGTEKGFEGADESAKYYQRNLRMYSNLNRIKLNKDDRVFILLGASHTAFFRDFISRSPKYEMVNTFDYLK
jgi:uncharacterized protein YfkK (UPF0435 family)